MKKLFVLVLGLIVVESAWAGCTRLSCGNWDPMNGSVKVSASGNQCWFCGPGPNSCSHLDVVPYKDAMGDVVALYQCHTSELYGLGVFDTNRFVSYNPGEFCENSQLKAASVDGVKKDNAKVTYALKGEKTSAISLGDLNGFDGSASCIVVKCNSGYVPNEAKTECVTPDTLCTAGHVYIGNECVEKKSVCEATGGTWEDNKTCTCDAKKQITQSSDKYSCECLSSEYSWYSDKAQGCYNKAAQSAREKCVNSWGEYKNNKCVCDAARNLVESNGECICKDSNYERDDASHTCKKKAGVITQEDCAQISDAQWVVNKCVCTEVGKLLDMTYMKCLYPDGYEACHNQSAVADWIDGMCVCKQAGYNWNGSSCVETSDHVIDGIFDKISAIEAKFDTSKWKNAEGKFNTARLASDSIAGVVLGTVGGVVTSTVVKKNQVKNGFEDIKCVIGGQTVASWGDQINVGLQ